METTRRNLLLSGVGLSAAGRFIQRVNRPGRRARGRARAGSSGKPLFEISLAQWSLHRTIRSGALDPLEFARFTRESFDIEAVEYVSFEPLDHDRWRGSAGR